MFKSYPEGLSTLFFTEMWERFSYYGMRGILLLFMIATVEDGGLGMDAQTSTAIYGLYTALVYLLALPGGWIADRLIGRQQAVFIGGLIIAFGHFCMAIPGLFTFFLGLGFIIAGTGLLKPNVSAMVGDLFSRDDERRDAGFSIFYMGINIGSFMGPIVCGFLGENINWHLGFAASGIGMVLGLVQYKLTARYLGDAGILKAVDNKQKRKDTIAFYKALVMVTVVILALWYGKTMSWLTITLLGVTHAMGIAIVSMVVIYFLYLFTSDKLGPHQKKCVAVIFLMFIGYAIFATGFEQAGSSMNLFAKNLTNRMIGGWQMPASWLQSVNALFIIIMAPVMGSLWLWLGHRNPSTLAKFSFGLLLVGSGFFVLAWGASFTTENGPGVSPMWLVVTYYLHTIGELCLSPVGLSSVSRLSPRHLVGQMMGIWFMGYALGNLIAGLVAGQVDNLPMDELFTVIAFVLLLAGIGFLIIAWPVSKMLNKNENVSVAETKVHI